MKIVNTDNFNGEYPNESFVDLIFLSKKSAKNIADAINRELSGLHAPRYWKVVDDDYELAPTLEDELRNK